jgi:hypothetical protein
LRLAEMRHTTYIQPMTRIALSPARAVTPRPRTPAIESTATVDRASPLRQKHVSTANLALYFYTGKNRISRAVLFKE